MIGLMTEIAEGLSIEILTSANGIGGKIEDLISHAKSDVYLISPYIQIDKDEEDRWDSISRVIRVALKKGITVHAYTRKDDHQSEKKLLDRFKER